ncbi:hypothetical protein C8F01DRAFT_1284828 [Mycena amicta]|nr:hypothetical protein C8F01DRAFT_1284828 [Mycena amicta]
MSRTFRWPWPYLTLRRLCISLAALFAVLLLLLMAHPTTRTRGYTILGIPLGPSYFLLRRKVARLPQHNLDLPFPEGKDGRYVKFSVQANWLGWNNCLNERLMNAHLAYVSNRAYVFADYWWAPEHYQFPPAPESGARTPMNALLAGPVVGAISERWWDTVCPPSRRRLINTEDIKPHIPGGLDHAPGSLIFETWHKLLLDATESCVEIVYTSLAVDSFPQIFDLRLWGGERVLSLWEDFLASPVSTLLRPSDIVRTAVENNVDAGVFLGLGRSGGRPPMSKDSRDPFHRMLAIHLRRGDYVRHCRTLASWGSGHYGWAQLPFLPDVAHHRLPNGSADDPQREAKAFAMCLPDVAGVVQRATEVQRDWSALAPNSELDIVYLLTNEPPGPFLSDLVAALHSAGWPTIVTTRDLRLNTAEQLDVSMAVDMEIAKRAAVFVGNGWSSFTSNVIHQRLVDGKDPMSIRLL